MSDGFRDRLRRLHDAHRRGKDSEGGPSGVYEVDDHDESPDDDETTPSATGGWEGLGASRSHDYPHPLWISRHRWAPDQLHGDWRIEQCRDVDHRLLNDLDAGLATGLDPEQLLYMDTETTGLGEGAMAFMIGLGFWDDEYFVVEHLLVEKEDDEPASLQAFAERLSDFEVLVTFNGTRFDVPLLEKRYDVHDQKPPFDDVDHLDLLPVSRRVFPGLKRYKLSFLEQQLLGFERVDDVPGRDIPRRWWKFKKNQCAESMAGVLEHNRHDVVSMMVLVAMAIAGESPATADRLVTSNRTSQLAVKMGLSSRKGRNDGGSSRGGSPESTDGIAKRLERAYRLRGRFGRRDESDESSSATGTEASTQSSRSALSEPAKKRIAELHRGAKNLIGQNMWREAFPMLCEIAVLSPGHEWALEKLAEYYRRDGHEELARQVERRGG